MAKFVKKADPLQEIKSLLVGFGERLDSLEKKIQPTATQLVEDAIKEQTPNVLEIEKEKDPTVQEQFMPPEFRKIVDDVLGEQFKAQVSYHDCPPTYFNFHVIIPKALSSVPKEVRGVNMSSEEDRRTKSISHALGANGVREWCVLIRKNLSKFYTKQGMPLPFKEVIE